MWSPPIPNLPALPPAVPTTYEKQQPARRGTSSTSSNVGNANCSTWERQNPLHIRLNGYRSDIRNKKLEKPVAAHFNTPGHSIDDLSIMVIERMKNEDPTSEERKLLDPPSAIIVPDRDKPGPVDMTSPCTQHHHRVRCRHHYTGL